MTEQLLLECEQYIRNGGILAGSSFGRIEIPSHKMMDIDTDAAEQYLQQHRENYFTEQMFAFIDRTGQKDSDIYKKALIDRRLFSKIRSNKKYIPAKRTVIALCLALELSREDADKLLFSAGYSLSRADDFDLVIAFCIEKKIFDFFDWSGSDGIWSSHCDERRSGNISHCGNTVQSVSGCPDFFHGNMGRVI